MGRPGRGSTPRCASAGECDRGMMNIAWTFTAAIVIFAAQRYAAGVEPMCSSPYSPECVEKLFGNCE
jgi:hypothetical protein